MSLRFWTGSRASEAGCRQAPATFFVRRRPVVSFSLPCLIWNLVALWISHLPTCHLLSLMHSNFALKELSFPSQNLSKISCLIFELCLYLGMTRKLNATVLPRLVRSTCIFFSTLTWALKYRKVSKSVGMRVFFCCCPTECDRLSSSRISAIDIEPKFQPGRNPSLSPSLPIPFSPNPPQPSLSPQAVDGLPSSTHLPDE
ncbi:uncharacterized protein V1516DRAFT_106372 [Lipomyces oligophaga]|uniref:uncharacterized protein n=1 Tax=Lipomyces oligophaga TaxID=45792 RepID=UPI0034CECD8C